MVGKLLKLSIFCAIILVSEACRSETINVGLAQFSKAEIDFTALLEKVVYAVQDRDPGLNLDLQIYPFNRSFQNLVNGSADIHLPVMVSDAVGQNLAALGLAFVKEPIGEITFSIYYLEDNLNMKVWAESGFSPEKQGDNLIITEVALPFFPKIHNLEGVSCRECGLNMVAKKRADGFLYGSLETEIVLAQGNFKNIKSSIFRLFDMALICRADADGHLLNERLSKAIRSIKNDGTLDEIMRPVLNFHEHLILRDEFTPTQ